MLYLDDIIWIDPYSGGQLESLERKVDRLERLVVLLLEQKYGTESEVEKDLN